MTSEMVDPPNYSFVRKKSKSETEYIHYPALYSSLSEDDRLYAQKELNETEENKAKGLQILREFVKKQGLTCTDDNLLVSVLRGCKYNFKKSEKKVKGFLKTRRLIIDRLKRLDMKIIESELDILRFTVLPYRDRYRRLITISQAIPNPDEYDMSDAIYIDVAIILFFFTLPMTQVYGMNYIPDNKNESFSTYYPLLKALKELIPHVGTFPVRFHRMDFTNEHTICHWLMGILRPFIPTKISKRVNFFGTNYQKLHEIYHPDLLPPLVGGNLDPFTNKHYREEFLNFVRKLRSEE